jgi:hypothetical protein
MLNNQHRMSKWEVFNGLLTLLHHSTFSIGYSTFRLQHARMTPLARRD